jgi:CRISPR-associated protein Cmr1
MAISHCNHEAHRGYLAEQIVISAMHTITFTCEIITPMFLSGADGSTPELRPSSIKGALRFWWRAMHGYLSITELHSKESDLFGGGGKNAIKSGIIVKTSHPKYDGNYQAPMLPHKLIEKEQSWTKAYKPNTQTYQVHLSLAEIVNDFDLDKMESLFNVTCLLGGLGRRSRRGFGSVMITKKDGELFSMPSSIDEIMLHIKKFNINYKIDNVNLQSKIYLLNSAFPERKYPYIEEITLGKKSYANYNDLLGSIGAATHDYKNDDPSLGYAIGKNRFASPVFVSAIKNGPADYRAIITTLHMAEKNKKPVNRQKQEYFKNDIL